MSGKNKMKLNKEQMESIVAMQKEMNELIFGMI
jgi:hypothetical protein